MFAIRNALALCALVLAAAPASAGVTLPSADLAASKSGPSETQPGAQISYTLDIQNFGPEASINATLEDVLPADLTFVSLIQDSGPTFSCTDPGAGNNGTVSCSIAQLNAGQNAQFTLVVEVPAQAGPGTSYTNIARVISGSPVDFNEENDSAPAVTTVPSPSTDVGVQKLGPESAGPDTDVAYTLSVVNAGPDDAADFTLTDTLPGDMTFVSLLQDSGPTLNCTTPALGAGGTVTCTLAAFPGGASATLTLVGHVPAQTVSGTQYTNSAQVTTSIPDANSVNDQATTTTTISTIDLLASKSGPATAAAGTQFNYTLAISNNGPDAATDATLTDVLPASLMFVDIVQDNGPAANCSTLAQGSSGTVVCSVGLLGPAQSAQFTMTVAVRPDAPHNSVADNAAVVDASEYDTDPSNDSSSVSTTLTNTVDVGIAKSAPATVNAGGTLGWTITASNAGPDVAANVTITDTLPAGTTFLAVAADAGLSCTTPAVGAGGTVTCTAATLASGAQLGFTLEALVDDAAADGSVIDNTANVETTSPDSNGNNATASAQTTVVNRADLGVSKSAPTGASAGATLTYTLVASNAGPLADAATLTDTLPADTSFASIAQTAGPTFSCSTPAVGSGGTVTCTHAAFAPGASATFSLVVNVADTAADASIINNTASIDGTRVDANAANDSDSADSTVSNTADLGIAKTAPAAANAGGMLTYTITASNAGPLADEATITDTLPADTSFVSLTQTAGPTFGCTTPAPGGSGSVSCTLASFASGAGATFALVVEIDAAAANGSSIANTAAIDGVRVDANAANDSATATTIITNAADLGIAKTAPAAATAGGTLSYTLTASNAGPLADDATITDTLPAGTTFQSLAQTSGPAFDCTTPAVGASGTVSCTLAGFASGATAAFTLVVNVTTANANGSTLANTAIIDGTRSDPNAGNDSATASSTVSNLPDLVLTKTATATVFPAGNIDYVLELSNTGTAAALDVVLTDALPAQTSFQSLQQTAGPAFACTAPAVGTNGTVTCNLASFAAGATARFAIRVSVAADATGTITNNASATTTSPEAAAGNNASGAGSVIVSGPGFEPVTIPALSWLGLMALAAAIALLGAAMTMRAR